MRLRPFGIYQYKKSFFSNILKAFLCAKGRPFLYGCNYCADKEEILRGYSSVGCALLVAFTILIS